MDIHKRWEQHLFYLSRNKHHSQKLQRHFNKYGKNDLVFSIIVGCDKLDLITTEQYFIDSYKPYFNGRLKAFNNGGFKLTDKSRKNISDSMKGEKHPGFGKHRSEETKQKISKSKMGIVVNLGRTHSEETKRKISKTKTGCKNPHIGVPHSDETKEILRQISKEYQRLKRMEISSN
jgi:hypothetical protein